MFSIRFPSAAYVGQFRSYHLSLVAPSVTLWWPTPLVMLCRGPEPAGGSRCQAWMSQHSLGRRSASLLHPHSVYWHYMSAVVISFAPPQDCSDFNCKMSLIHHATIRQSVFDWFVVDRLLTIPFSLVKFKMGCGICKLPLIGAEEEENPRSKCKHLVESLVKNCSTQ